MKLELGTPNAHGSPIDVHFLQSGGTVDPPDYFFVFSFFLIRLSPWSNPHARHTYLLVPTPPSLTFLLLFFGDALSPVSDAGWNVVQSCAGNRSCCEFLGAGPSRPQTVFHDISSHPLALCFFLPPLQFQRALGRDVGWHLTLSTKQSLVLSTLSNYESAH